MILVKTKLKQGEEEATILFPSGYSMAPTKETLDLLTAAVVEAASKVGGLIELSIPSEESFQITIPLSARAMEQIGSVESAIPMVGLKDNSNFIAQYKRLLEGAEANQKVYFNAVEVLDKAGVITSLTSYAKDEQEAATKKLQELSEQIKKQ